MPIGEEKSGTLASEVETATSDLDGTRHSRDSDWSEFNCPDDFAINKEKTQVEIGSERGSEHEYSLEYENYVEVIEKTGITMPQKIKVKTHARSSKGPKGGGGAMKVKVTYWYVKFR